MSVLAISSQVVRGHVGNSAAVPVLVALGCAPWPVPTIVLSHHPGHGTPASLALPATKLAAFVDSLEAHGWLAELRAVMTGYFATPDQVAAAAEAIARVRKAARAPVTVLVDPIIGDAGHVYVREGVPEAIREHLLPQADIATPNLFELGWLSGDESSLPASGGQALDGQAMDEAGVIARARKLGPAEVVVTSAPAPDGAQVATLAVTAHGIARHTAPRFEPVPHGLGDTLAAAYLGHRLNGLGPAPALKGAADAVAALIAAAAREGLDELPLTRMQHLFHSPPA